MKKKIPIFIFLAAVGIIAAGLVFYIQQHKQPLAVQDVLPAQPLFYLHSKDLERTFQEFEQSAFMKKFSQIKFKAAIKEVGAPPQELMLYDQLGSQVFSKKNQDIFFKLFGREVTLAVYPPKSDVPAMAMIEMASSICVVTRLKPEVRFIEVFTAALSKFYPEINERVTEYKGRKIHLIAMKGGIFKVGYVRFGDLLVFGIGDTAAKRAIDATDDKTLALAQDESFLNAQNAFLEGAEYSSFFNYALILEQMKGLIVKATQQGGKVDPAIQQKIEEGFDDANGFKMLMFSVHYANPIHAQVDFSFDRAKMPDDVREFYKESLSENRSLAFIPQTSEIYSWTSWMKFKFYWKHMKEELAKNASQPSGSKETVPSKILALGPLQQKDLDRLFTLLTDQIGWYLSGIERSKFSPIPQAVLFLGINDEQGIRDFLNEMIEEKGSFRLTKENYQGVEIRHFENFPFFNGLEPAYCILEGYLVLATNTDLLKQAIDVRDGKAKALRTNAVFTQERYGLLGKNNGVFFVDNDRLIDVLEKTLQWANQWADTQYARYQAFKAGTQQRLDDVKRDVAKAQSELDTLEQELVSLQNMGSDDKEADVREESQRLQEKLERKRKIAQSVDKALEELSAEEKDMVSAQEDQNKKLTEEGRTRLAEVRADIEKRQARRKEIQADIDAVDKQAQQVAAKLQSMEDRGATVKEKESEFKEKRNAMRALQDKQTELEDMLKSYDKANLPTPDQRNIIVEKAIKPLLETLRTVSWGASKSTMSGDEIHSEFFIKVKE